MCLLNDQRTLDEWLEICLQTELIIYKRLVAYTLEASMRAFTEETQLFSAALFESYTHELILIK